MSLGYYAYGHEALGCYLNTENQFDSMRLTKSKKKSFIRRGKRRLERFLKRRKSSKLHKEFMKLQKYSSICLIANGINANPAVPFKKDPNLQQLFMYLMQEALYFLKAFLRYATKLVKKGGKFVVGLLKNHPWFTAFLGFTACALLVFHYLSKKFGKKLTWLHRLLVILLLLGIVILLAVAIKYEAFSTIREWIKRILLNILLGLRAINDFLTKKIEDSPSNSLSIKDEVQLPNLKSKDNFKNFLLYSTLVFVATRYLLKIYKRRLVGESPFTDIVIDFIECYTPSEHQMES